MEMFIDAALGTEWEPEMKQRYLQHFVAYVPLICERARLCPLNFRVYDLFNKPTKCAKLCEHVLLVNLFTLVLLSHQRHC